LAQSVSRRSVTAEIRVQSQVSPGEICGGQSGTGTGFPSSISSFPRQYNSTSASYSSSCMCCIYEENKTGEAWEPSKKQCSFANPGAFEVIACLFLLVGIGGTEVSPSRHGQPTYRASARARISRYFVRSYHCYSLPVSGSTPELVVIRWQHRDISERPAPEIGGVTIRYEDFVIKIFPAVAKFFSAPHPFRQ
jgi:hypothetical protein